MLFSKQIANVNLWLTLVNLSSLIPNSIYRRRESRLPNEAPESYIIALQKNVWLLWLKETCSYPEQLVFNGAGQNWQEIEMSSNPNPAGVRAAVLGGVLLLGLAE